MPVRETAKRRRELRRSPEGSRSDCMIRRISSRTAKNFSITAGIPLLARSVAQNAIELLVGHALAIGPVAGHRVERIGHGHDPGQQWNLIPRQPERIAVAVPSFVVMPHDRQHLVELLDVLREFDSRFRRAA